MSDSQDSDIDRCKRVYRMMREDYGLDPDNPIFLSRQRLQAITDYAMEKGQVLRPNADGKLKWVSVLE